MVASKTSTVAEYLESLPTDRRAAVDAVRKVVRKSLPREIEEGIQHGMIGWYVPLSRHASTYNGQPLSVAALASQKASMSLYLPTVQGDVDARAALEIAARAAGKKLDMGKSCLRFRTLDALPLEAIAEVLSRVTVASVIANYERGHAASPSSSRSAATTSQPGSRGK